MPRVHLPDGRVVNFPDNMSAQDIGAAVEQIAGGEQKAPQAPTSSGGSANFDPNPLNRIGSWAINKIKENPVGVLSTLGAVAAVPLTGGGSLIPSIAAAGLGGAGGAGLGIAGRQIATGKAENAGDTLRTMATEGAVQGSLEGAGGVVGKGLVAAGKQMYRGALRPSATLRRKYPNIVEQGLEEGAIVGGRDAKPRMMAKMKASKAEADAMRAEVQAGGAAPLSRRDVRQPLVEMAKESRRAAQLTGTADETKAIAERARKLQSSYGLDEAHEAARIMNDRAEQAFKAERMGGAPASVNARIDKALAQAFSGGVKDRVPGLAEQNLLTSNRMGLAKALGDAAERPSVLANIGMAGTAAGIYGLSGQDMTNSLLAGAAVRGVASPRVLSSAGIAATRGGRTPFANLFRAALLSQLAEEE